MAWGHGNLGGGGSSGGLNVTLIASTTQPNNPAENTIWINSNVAINGWAFASAAPTGAQDGAVWIQTTTDSTVAFNAAKRGILMVYPLMCKQRISGAWTEVTAKSYINGAWRDWLVYLYSPGNPHTELTGGWEGVAHRRQDKVDSYDVISAKPSVNTQGTDYMEVTLAMTYPNNGSGSARTVNKIDLTNFDQIIFNLTFPGSTVYVYVTTSDTSYSAVKQLAVTGGTNKAAALDVSDLSGEYYVGINLLAASSTVTVKVNKVELK
jgi:hypothetical protein